MGKSSSELPGKQGPMTEHMTNDTAHTACRQVASQSVVGAQEMGRHMLIWC
jgi:hypothetical protein